MNNKILSKKNTNVHHQEIDGDVFISVHAEQEACALIDHVDNITVSILEEMKELVPSQVAKVIASAKDYELIKSALGLVFENVKFVKRNTPYEIYFKASPGIIRASHGIVKEEKKIGPIKVLIVDDSATICNLLQKIMSLSPEIKVVGKVNNPLEAAEKIEELKPDVITLDIHMPHLNGVELLKQIGPKYKIPAIMISSISMKEGPLVLEALDNGAVDYIQKPDMANFAAVANEINLKIIQASTVKFCEKKVSRKVIRASDPANCEKTLILIGASTGGTKALKEILDELPASIPPILIVQHIPGEFSKAFADRLNTTSKFLIKQAEDGDKVLANQVLIAPGGKQMRFVYKSEGMFVEINDDAPVNRFQPSVDYMFDSVVASNYKNSIVAAIFTGMGKDGSRAMKRLKDVKGAITIAQDKESSVVFGMPKEAINLGCVDHIVSLQDAPAMLMEASNSKKAA